MINFITKLSELGTLESDDVYNRRSIILTNYISLIIATCIFIVVLIRMFYFSSLSTYFQPLLYILDLIHLIPIVLNYFGFTRTSRILLNYICVSFVWVTFLNGMTHSVQIETSYLDGMRMYLLAMSCIPYLILGKQKTIIFILGILPTMLSIIFLESIVSYLFAEKFNAMSHGMDYELMNMRATISYVVVGGCCYGLHHIILKSDEENERLVKKLNDQNKLLLQQQELLNHSNLRLEKIVEERTEKIRIQNERILSYAYTNAHHIRGPIARLLGLSSLVKMEHRDTYPFYLEKIENESKDLDIIVKNLSQKLDSISDV